MTYPLTGILDNNIEMVLTSMILDFRIKLVCVLLCNWCCICYPHLYGVWCVSSDVVLANRNKMVFSGPSDWMLC